MGASGGGGGLRPKHGIGREMRESGGGDRRRTRRENKKWIDKLRKDRDSREEVRGRWEMARRYFS